MPGLNAAKNGAVRRRAGGPIPLIGTTTSHMIRGDKLAEKGIDPATLLNHNDRREAALAISGPDFYGWGLTPNQSGDGFGYLIGVDPGLRRPLHRRDRPDRAPWTRPRRWPRTSGSGRPTTATASMPRCCRRVSRAGPIRPTTKPGSPGRSATRTTRSASMRSPSATTTRSMSNTVLLRAPQALNGDSRDGGNVGGWMTIFKGSTNTDLAKQLALNLLDPANFGKISAAGGVLFTPAYTNLWTDELVATDPNLAIIKEQVSVTDPFLGESWPASPNAGISAIRAQGVLEQSVANVISGRMAPADAVKDAHQKMRDIFEEGGMMQPYRPNGGRGARFPPALCYDTAGQSGRQDPEPLGDIKSSAKGRADGRERADEHRRCGASQADAPAAAAFHRAGHPRPGLEDRLPFVLPMALLMVGLILWPFINSIWLSTTAFNFTNGETTSVGLRNYERLFRNSDYLLAMGNTINFTFWSLCIKFVTGMTIALILHSRVPMEEPPRGDHAAALDRARDRHRARLEEHLRSALRRPQPDPSGPRPHQAAARLALRSEHGDGQRDRGQRLEGHPLLHAAAARRPQGHRYRAARSGRGRRRQRRAALPPCDAAGPQSTSSSSSCCSRSSRPSTSSASSS